MKSEHRHELKTNELADWMAHLPEWSKKNAKPLIGGTALVAVIVVAVLWSQYNNTVLAQAHRSQFTNDLANLEFMINQVAQSSSQGDDMSINLGESSINLAKLAQDATTDGMAALAYLKQAEMLREQIHFEQGQPSNATIAERIETAKEAYNNALTRAKANSTLMSLAQYGLGLCAEELGQFDEAERLYQTLITDETYAGTLGRTSAVNRIKSMSGFDGVIVFPVVEEVPEVSLPEITQAVDGNSPAPVTQPEIGPALPQITPPVASPNAVAVPDADANVTQ